MGRAKPAQDVDNPRIWSEPYGDGTSRLDKPTIRGRVVAGYSSRVALNPKKQPGPKDSG